MGGYGDKRVCVWGQSRSITRARARQHVFVFVCKTYVVCLCVQLFECVCTVCYDTLKRCTEYSAILQNKKNTTTTVSGSDARAHARVCPLSHRWARTATTTTATIL